jgi:UDP-N-acetylmuramoylalanine--D-glutamate ligase
MNHFSEKRVIVLGLDNSGRSVVRHLSGRCKSLSTFDEFHQDADINLRSDLNFSNYDICIAAPFLSPDDALLLMAKNAGVEVISELEVASLLRAKGGATGEPIPWVGITGTNGKSTTVGIAAAILRRMGKNVQVVLDGDSILDGALNPNVDILLLEVSAFMLHFTSTISLDVSALLNVFDEQLGWHAGKDDYVSDKAKIYQNTVRYCLYNVHDRITDSLVQNADVVEGARAVGFSHHTPARSQIGTVEGYLLDRAFYADESDPLRFLEAGELADLNGLDKFYSPHVSGVRSFIPKYTLQNIAAAACVARAYGATPEHIVAGLNDFVPLSGRNQLVYTRKLYLEDGFSEGEIIYIDDTHSINTRSTSTVLGLYPKASVIWIVSGYISPSNDVAAYDFISKVLDRLAAVVVIGGEESEFYKYLRKYAQGIPVYAVELGENAVNEATLKASSLALSYQACIFSPAASMDKLLGYQDVQKIYRETLKNISSKIENHAKEVGWYKR